MQNKLLLTSTAADSAISFCQLHMHLTFMAKSTALTSAFAMLVYVTISAEGPCKNIMCSAQSTFGSINSAEGAVAPPESAGGP